MIILNEKFAEIKWDEIHKVTIVTFHGYMSSEQLRFCYEKLLECMVNFKCANCIIDGRNYLTIKPEDQDWIINDWGHRVFKSVGKGKVAGILPENIIQRQVINKVSGESGKKNEADYKFFVNIEEALRWLRT